jgi:arylesterase / paraoxonase
MKICLTLALLVPFIYERGQVLSLFYANAPVRMPRIDKLGAHGVKFADKIRNCEDGLLIESAGLAVLPCDPGRERWNSVMVSIPALRPLGWC